jgi:L-2,4-diaminobutyrate decarboxylase
MNDFLKEVYNPDHFRQQGHALVDMLADFLEAVETRRDAVAIPYQTPEAALAFWQADFDKPTNADPSILFKEVLARSTRLHHPHTMGHQVPPPAPIAALAGLASDLLNNGMAVYEMGMVSNALERIISTFLAQNLGFDAHSAGGLLTSGGTLANLTALLAARAAKAPTAVWTEGSSHKLAIMVSEEAHYCVDRAARIMGLGTMGIVKVPSDAAFRMRVDLLETYLEKAQADGLTVFAIVGSCCSTSTGSHDNLEAVADFAQKHNLWFHADGAHGGAAIFSEKHKPLLKGIERADSVVIDFHKMLLTPALATALVFRKAGDSLNTFQQKADYLWGEATEDWHNSGKRTFECTKYMMSLKVYAILKTHGVAAFRANVDVLYGLGKAFAQLIEQRAGFELALAPECNIVCFRKLPKNGEDINVYNNNLRQKLIENKGFYIVQTVLRGTTYLRTSLMNPLIETSDLTDLLDALDNLD